MHSKKVEHVLSVLRVTTLGEVRYSNVTGAAPLPVAEPTLQQTLAAGVFARIGGVCCLGSSGVKRTIPSATTGVTSRLAN